MISTKYNGRHMREQHILIRKGLGCGGFGLMGMGQGRKTILSTAAQHEQGIKVGTGWGLQGF